MTEAWPDRSRLETTSLEQLLAALGAARDGDFSVRLPGSADPLLDDIAASFNALATRLSERAAARSQLLPALSHELRTPLNSMVVLARLLAQNPSGNLTPEQVEYANVIHSAGTDLVSVISNLVDPNRDTGREPGPDAAGPAERRLLVVEATRGGLLTLLARGAISDLAGSAGPVGVSTAASADEVTEALAAGPHQCVVLDLSAGGTLPSRTMEQVRAHPHSRHAAVLCHARQDLAAAQFTLLRASETAQPIELLRSPDELRERIAWHLSAAEKEMEADAPSGGIAANGAIVAPPGSRPAANGSPAGPGPAGASVPAARNSGSDGAASLRGKKVLVVDDDPRNVFALTSTLELYGMTVLRGADGRAGIDQLMHEPDTDLVLMDLMMPGMDGYTAISAIRGMPEFSELPIIAVTARTITGNLADSVPGANDCLSKPLDTDELLGRMARCLAS
jgi:CheY-like chemotaxis protein